MPMADMFWGDYWGMVQDAYGIHWMISFNTMQQQFSAKRNHQSKSGKSRTKVRLFCYAAFL
jgi:uncharacterized glyoxalase superfamily protein PhnB